MAGPMVGPLLESLGLELIETYWTPDGSFPDHEPNPLLRGEPALHHREGPRARAPISGSPGTGTPTAASSSTTRGEFVRRRLPHRAAGGVAAAQASRARRSSYDVRASRAVPDTVRRPAASRYVNRVGHAFFKTRMRKEGSLFGGEVSGHYYFRDFYCADSGTIPALLMLELLGTRGHARCPSCSRPTASATSSPARSTPRSPTSSARWRRSPSATPTPRQGHLDGISIDYEDWHFNVRPSNTEPLLRLCLESLRLPRGHGAPPRRGARADPLVSAEERATAPSARRWREAAEPRASTAWRSRRPSWSGASTPT